MSARELMWQAGVAAAMFAMLALMFVPLERAWQARRQRVLRPEFGLDVLFFAGQYLVWNGLVVGLLSALQGLRQRHVGWSLDAWPWWGQLAVMVLGGEVVAYWLHRAMHHVGWLWRIHRVHHSSTHLDWLAAHREHPLDGLLVQLAMNAPALLCGLSPGAFGAVVMLRGLWAIVVHSNTRLPLGPLRWLLGAPEWHRFHHRLLDANARTYNFANLCPVLDWLWGTHGEARHEAYPLGVREGHREGGLRRYVREVLLRRP